MGKNGLPVKSPACAYVGSNPTPATHNRRSGPVCGPGLMHVRERFQGPCPVSVGQLRATSVPGDRHRAGTLAITEGENPPGGTAVRLAHIDAPMLVKGFI